MSQLLLMWSREHRSAVISEEASEDSCGWQQLLLLPVHVSVECRLSCKAVSSGQCNGMCVGKWNAHVDDVINGLKVGAKERRV